MRGACVCGGGLGGGEGCTYFSEHTKEKKYMLWVLIRTPLMSTHNICCHWGMKKKINTFLFENI